jgi:ABC-type glycerol-3-phosphate transport system substrate-binding protein
MEAFNNMHPSLFVKLDPREPRPTSLSKILVQCDSGVGPDFFDVQGSKDLQSCIEAGAAMDLTEFAKNPEYSSITKNWPGVEGQISFQGRQYAYPANVGVALLIYNKNIFDKFHVPYPSANMTWEECISLAKRVTYIAPDPRDSIYGVHALSWYVFFGTLHGEFFSEDGTKLLLLDGRLKKAFEMHRDVMFKHRISPTVLDVKSMSGQGGWGGGGGELNLNLFASGRFAMVFTGKHTLIAFRNAYQDQKERLHRWNSDHRGPRPELLRLGSIPLPHMSNQAPCNEVFARAVVVNKNSPHVQDALKFLKFLSGPEYSTLLNKGCDSSPPNPKYSMLGIEKGIPDLSELEMHRNTDEAMVRGYQRNISPFLFTSDVVHLLLDQTKRLESNPDLDIDKLMEESQQILLKVMQRNIDRNPTLREQYFKLTGSSNVKEVHSKEISSFAQK